MNKRHIIILMLMFFVLSVTPSFAAESEIPLPGTIEVENKSDMTLGLLTQIFGDPFSEIAGKSTFASHPMASTLVGILGMLNFLAMLYVGAGVAYLWVVFAATTAHDGQRIGGGVYDSLWIPIRQAGAFVMTVPILNGLSVMQMLIMASVAMSINFANTIWTTASNYMIKYANVSIIETAAAPIDQDIYRLLPLMFKDSVIQQIALQLVEEKPGKPVFPMKSATSGEVLYYPVDWNGNASHDQSRSGPKIGLFTDQEKGQAILRIRTTTNMDPNSIGSVIIDYPKPIENTTRFGDALAASRLKAEIAHIRIKALSRLWGEVYKTAEIYLNSRASSPTQGSGCAIPLSGGGEVCLPSDDAQKAIVKLVNITTPQIISQMAKEVNDATKRRVETLDRQRLEGMMSSALDTEDGTPRYGWVSAGLFPLSLGLLQKEYNVALEGHISSMPGNFELAQHKIQKVLKNSNLESGLKKAEGYFNAQAIQSKAYSSSFLQTSFNRDGGVDKGLGAIQRSVTNFFAGDAHKNSAQYSGILGIILAQLGTYDPVVVMQNFGDKLFNAATDWKTLGIAAAADFTLGSSFAIMSIILLIGVACFFSYVVPLIPLLYWMQAVISWLFMVIEAMVAAPFWVAMHIMPEGRGLTGDHARKGYLLLLECIIRPALLVVGAVFAVALCQTAGWFINRLLSHWFGSIANDFLSIGFFGDLMYTILVLSLIYYIFYMIFTKGITYMPEKVLAWCGAGSGMGLQGGEQTLKKTLAAGGVLVVGSTGHAIGASASKAVGVGRSKALEQWRKHKQKKEHEKQNNELAEKVRHIVQAQIAENTGGDKPEEKKLDGKPKSEADERLEKWVGGLVRQEQADKKTGEKVAGEMAEKKEDKPQADDKKASEKTDKDKGKDKGQKPDRQEKTEPKNDNLNEDKVKKIPPALHFRWAQDPEEKTSQVLKNIEKKS